MKNEELMRKYASFQRMLDEYSGSGHAFPAYSAICGEIGISERKLDNLLCSELGLSGEEVLDLYRN